MPVTEDWRLMFGESPPAADFPDEWPNAVPIEDATIPPEEHWDLVTHVRYTGPGDAHLGLLIVVYEQGGREYRADTFISLDLVEGACGASSGSEA